MLMEDPQRALLWRLPPPIAPLTHEQLAARREVKRTLRRASQTVKPVHVSTDAAYHEKRAGVAYVSPALGNRATVLSAAGSTEAEFWAVLMAMHDADRCLPRWQAIVFRTDCMTVGNFMLVKKQRLRTMRAEMVKMLRVHPRWAVVLVKRAWNEHANQLARTALDEATPTMRRRHD
jgi:hypothetical protein